MNPVVLQSLVITITKMFLPTVRCQHIRFVSSVQTEENHHSIIKDNEKPTGQLDKHEFQAETRMLLDIVARSLYSEKEVSGGLVWRHLMI